MLDNQILKQLIVKRKSTRTFSGNKLTDEQIYDIKRFMGSPDNKKGIFGFIRFELLENKNNSVFGAYGDIVGASYYIAVITKNNKNALIDAGYAFERLILFAENMGLNTCWLAATSFDRNEAELRVNLADDEIIAAISPIGKKATQPSERERIERERLGSDGRLSFDTLFADASTGGIIIDKQERESLEAVRITPSALNNQPWRVVVDNGVAHFYVIRRFILPLNYDFQMLDLGAAVFHYCTVSNKYDSFQLDAHSKQDLEYVISVK